MVSALLALGLASAGAHATATTSTTTTVQTTGQPAATTTTTTKTTVQPAVRAQVPAVPLKPTMRDAITGEPVDVPVFEEEEKKSLRDEVREKIKEETSTK